MKKIILRNIILIVFSSLFVFFNISENDTLLWKSDFKLEWNNFKSKECFDLPGDLVASTSTLLSYKIPKVYKDTIYIYVVATFNQNLSCVDTSKFSSLENNLYCLNHEQVHFDITEIYAREFRKELANISLKANDLNIISKIHEKYLILWQKEQELYDTETRHSNLVGIQEKWNDKIIKKLNQLNSYNEILVKVAITN